jgi:transglutaminase-like putative cysteine protease
VNLNVAVTLSYHVPQPADILLAIEAIPMADQRLIEDKLIVNGSGPLVPVVGGDGLGRRTWLTTGGALEISYTASVNVERAPTALAGLTTTPHPQLPNAYIPYLMPSRYCPSDLVENFVQRRFKAPDKGAMVAMMADWIYDQIAYVPGSTGFRCTASDILISREGVCRDFAHLLITFARAADIPARMVSAYALGVDPPDFHAVVEVYLGGRWHLVDPTRLAPEQNIVRIAVGRDATDIGFMTIFGTATALSQSVVVTEG